MISVVKLDQKIAEAISKKMIIFSHYMSKRFRIFRQENTL